MAPSSSPPRNPVAGDPAPDLHLDRPHSARMYDYYLGGKDNYLADRQAAGQVVGVWPGILVACRSNRLFMHRSTHFLAERGVRQYLDIGTGIPTSPNLHEVAQSIVPDARVVYTDNDPIVLTHAQALMAGRPEGRTAYIDADVTDPESILGSPELTRTLDLSEPVALSLNALLHFVPDDRNPRSIVERLLSALAPGSYLCLSHVTPDFDSEATSRAVEIYRSGGIAAQVRSLPEILEFFDGLHMLEPGVVPAHRWRPGPGLLRTGGSGGCRAAEGPGRAGDRPGGGPGGGSGDAPGGGLDGRLGASVIQMNTGSLTDAEVSMYAGLAVKP